MFILTYIFFFLSQQHYHYLLDSPEHSDGKDTTTIIAVSVAIPIAVCIVFMVILAALMLIVINCVRSKLRKGGMVNFTTRDLLRRDVDRKDHVVTL